MARAPLTGDSVRHTPHRTRPEPRTRGHYAGPSGGEPGVRQPSALEPGTPEASVLEPDVLGSDVLGPDIRGSEVREAEVRETEVRETGVRETGVRGSGLGELDLTRTPLLPGVRTMRRQLCFLLVTSFTMASLGLGVLAILLAMRGDVQAAAICLVGCVLLDGVDGMLARLLRVTSPFGAQMDSLADMCAFGVAAPVVVYASIVGTVPAPAAAIACAMVAGCAAIRLARFNVSPKDGRFFTGLPTTLAAAVLALVVLIELPLPPHVVLLGVAVLAFAMVSSFPYATLARLLRMPPWLWLVPVAGALVNARLAFVVLVGAYLASGPLLWLHNRRLAT